MQSSYNELLPLLQSEDATLRDDTADLLGRIGARGALEQLLSDANTDVREIAEEALEGLLKPS